MKINPCKCCGNIPLISDVGGYVTCIEICCIECNRAEYGRTTEEAITIWNSTNKEVKK